MAEAERKRVLIILNDPPYGTERSYDGLRLVNALGKEAGVAMRLFLLADAVSCGRAGQRTPQGYYNLEKMLQVATRQGTDIGA